MVVEMDDNIIVVSLKFRDFFLRASTVETAEAKFGIDEYSDVIMLAKPVIYISAKEICSTHQVSS